MAMSITFVSYATFAASFAAGTFVYAHYNTRSRVVKREPCFEIDDRK
jgi:hypothetical protein